MSVVSVEKDYDRRSLVLVAEFEAPIDQVWRLWADPRLLERWWGPPTHPATVEKHHLPPAVRSATSCPVPRARGPAAGGA